MSRVAEFAPRLPEASRSRLLALFQGDAETLKASDRGEVRRLTDPGLGTPLIAKRYPAPGLLRSAAKRLRGSEGRREFRASLRLAARGVPVVAALALLEERSGPFVGASTVVLEDLGRVATLADALREGDGRSRRDLLERAGRLAAKLHGAGFVHGDLHAGNFLLRPDGSLVLGDLARVRSRGPGLAPRSLDLAHLAHSLRERGGFERARCLHAYAREAGISFRRLARSVFAATLRRGLRRAAGAFRNAAQPVYGRSEDLPPGWRGIGYAARSDMLARAIERAGKVGRGPWLRTDGPSGSVWVRSL
ncbi:MAG: lipopolysaccharide kinase InaA family protein, partial [Planctomycetota bacterium]